MPKSHFDEVEAGKLHSTGTLAVAGATSLGGTLAVVGAGSIGGALVVAGEVTSANLKEKLEKLTSLAFDDVTTTTKAVQIGVLPAGKILTGIFMHIKEGFNGTGMAINVGAGTVDGVSTAFLATAAITEATIGAYGATTVALGAATTGTPIWASETFDTAGTTGLADFYIRYIDI